MRVQQISLELIDVDPNQPRRTLDEIEQLAGSMNVVGQLQPSIVAQVAKRFQMIDGHRRLAALQTLGRKEMAAIVLEEIPSPNKLLFVQLTANCLRSDLKPVEKAHAFDRLKSMNKWTNADLAKGLSISKSQVTETLSHLTHSPEVQAKINSGEISPSLAYTISRAQEETTRKAMFDDALKGELSRDEAARRVNRRAKSKSKATRMVCQLPDATVTIATTGAASLDAFGKLLRKLGQQCAQAAKDGYDIGTLESILADKCRNQVKAITNGPSS